MKKYYIATILFVLPFFAPKLAFAQGIVCPTAPFRNITEIINWGLCLIGDLIPLLFTLAFLFFLWTVLEFIRNADNENKRKEGRVRLIWGIVALTVMVSVWGLVAILRGTFGVENLIPQIK